MARNGSGQFDLLVNSWNPATNGVLATAGDWQSLINDIAAALTQSVSRDGQAPMTGNLALGNNKITGLSQGTGTGQALAFEQLFSQGVMSDLASATTTDIGLQNTNFLRITGNTTITSFGSNYRGPRFLVFEGAVTLTNSSTLVLPGGANITTAAGDVLIAIPGATLGTADKWIVAAYQRKNGVYIDASGNVGVGTSSPRAKFDANGASILADSEYGYGLIELGKYGTGDRPSYIDFHASGTPGALDYSARLVRTNGVNGLVQLLNTGTGELALQQEGAAPIIFRTSNTERARIDSSGNVGIGTSSPEAKLDVNGPQINRGEAAGYVLFAPKYGTTPLGINFDRFEIRVDPSNPVTYLGNANGGTGAARDLALMAGNAEGARIDTNGNFKFNSGYGSAATAYGCRAWVNFNGTGTVAIRASGNVSSITDNGVGDYTVNFTTAMPDANYSAVSMTVGQVGPTVARQACIAPSGSLAGSVRVVTGSTSSSSLIDVDAVCISIFR